jgi:hypothetical protein
VSRSKIIVKQHSSLTEQRLKVLAKTLVIHARRAQASVGQSLHTIAIPTLFLSAMNDPIACVTIVHVTVSCVTVACVTVACVTVALFLSACLPVCHSSFYPAICLTPHDFTVSSPTVSSSNVSSSNVFSSKSRACP